MAPSRPAREIIDGIPAIDLPAAIAFLEFLRQRGGQALGDAPRAETEEEDSPARSVAG